MKNGSRLPAGKTEKSYLLLIFPILFFLFLFVIPFGKILFAGFSLKGIQKVFTDRYYLKVIGFTVYQALLSTVFAVLAGLPGAYLMAKYRFPGKRLIRALTTVPFVLPSILVVLGFVILFGNNGIINRTAMRLFGLENPPFRILYKFSAIILAHVFYNFPIVIRLCSRYWARVGEKEEQAAAILGAGRIRVFFTITLPKLLPSILSAASLVFIYCFLSFAIIRILGGGPEFSTVEIEIFRLSRTGSSWTDISNLAVAGTAISILFLWLNIYLQKKTSRQLPGTQVISERKLFAEKNIPLAAAALAYFAAAALLIAGPLAAIAWNSLVVNRGFSADRIISLKWYSQMFSAGGGLLGISGIVNTLLIALMSMLFSLLIGFGLSYIISRNRKYSVVLESVFSIPISVSTVVLGIGFLSMSGSVSGNPLAVRVVIALAHSVISYPIVMRGISAYYLRYSRNLFYAAALAGASPPRILGSIDLPLLLRPMISAGLFSFALSAGEFNIALVFSHGKINTIPVLMYRLIGAYRINAACAYGVLLIVLSLAMFALLEKDEGIM